MCKYNKGLGDAIEYAAEHLPGGRTIEIYVEQGSAGVRLEDPDMEGAYFGGADMSLTEEVLKAVSVARGTP